MPAERAVLEQAPAFALDSVGVPAYGAPDVVDDADDRDRHGSLLTS